jgi:EAL domain-containing protein (putative c-di-GMP-specific phosphodiesterase class I)
MHNRLATHNLEPLSMGKSYSVFLESWQGLLQDFLNEVRVDARGSQVIFTIIEWQYFAPNILNHPKEQVLSVMQEVEKIIHRHIKYLNITYLGFDKLLIAVRHQDVALYEVQMRELFGMCLAYGATIKPTPMLLNFKAGSACSVACDIGDIDNTMVALLEAKESSHQSHRFFRGNPASLQDLQYHSQMASYFLEAIHSKRLRLAFQPVIDARNGHIDCYEALLRVVTLEGDIISAGPFIKAAEALGFMDLVDKTVLEAVAYELHTDERVRIAMNISSTTASDSAWIASASHLLQPFEKASRLIVEITETSREDNLETMVLFADKLRWLGCQIAIDDFGSGYTSFMQLKMVNADYLKIDGVFIRNILTSPDSKLFIKILIDFARAYGIKTVAEFVETGEIAKSLIDLGIDYLQGYYFSRALDYRPWITSDSA